MNVTDLCITGQFTVDVNVSSTGDEATAHITYTVNGGGASTISNVGTGITNLGNFNQGDNVAITLEHAFDAPCDVDLGSHTDSGNCPPIVTCGTPLAQTHCYGNNESSEWRYMGSSPVPLTVTFNDGYIQNSSDRLRMRWPGQQRHRTVRFIRWQLQWRRPERCERKCTLGNDHMSFTSNFFWRRNGFNGWEWEVRLRSAHHRGGDTRCGHGVPRRWGNAHGLRRHHLYLGTNRASAAAPVPA
ncbi:MAG: hypothetical protein R2818_12930 [Flavobacteriales bacterium]